MPGDFGEALGFVTKILVPQRREDVLRRPRLVEFLHQHLDRRLILVSASAGYGKTTLLVDFANDTNLPVCWYSLDEYDADPGTFLRYLIAAIRRRFPNFGEQTERLIRNVADVGKDLKPIVGTLVSEMHSSIPEYFVIVLDDYHLVDSSDSVNDLLNQLLHYLPEHCHLVLSTRTIPRLAISRLVARRHVAGLGVADLRFTAEEIRELMSKNYDVALPLNRAEELAAESEGWITGILLTTHTMWQGLFQTMIRARESGGQVFDFLATEVFAQQPPQVQGFLLESSILRQMTPTVCDHLLGITGSREMLTYLEDVNLFVSRIEGESSWFRYHHLFHDFLQSKLERERPERFKSLHLAAGATFEDRGDWNEAFQHYTKAVDEEGATRIVLSASDIMFTSGQWQTMLRWMSALSARAVAAHPEILIHEASARLQVGDIDQALEVLSRAGTIFRQAGDDQNLARVYNWRSIAKRFKGRSGEAVEESQQAIHLLKEGSSSLAVQAHRNLGVAFCMAGDHVEGIAELKRSLRIAEEIDDFHNVAGVNHELGTAYLNCGNPALAMYHYERAATYWRRVGNSGYLGHALNGVGVVQYYLGQYDRALETFEEALAKAREAGYLRVESTVQASTGDLYRDQKKLPQAMEAYESSLQIARRVDESFLVAYCLDAIGMTHLLLGNIAQAEKLIKQAIDHAEERGSRYELGLFNTSAGIVLCEKNELKRAVGVLKQACRHLQQSNASRELARVEFHLARSLFLRHQHDESLRHFETVLKLVSELGYDHFLVVEGWRAVDFLRFALARGCAPDVLGSVLKRIGAEAPTTVATSAEVALSEVVKAKAHSLELYALGQTHVFLDERLITNSEWAVEKTREVLFYFVTHPAGLRKDQLIEALWPDLTPGKGDSNFHSTTYRLRRALYQDCLIYENSRYRFDFSGLRHYDVHEFESLIHSGESEQPAEAKMDLLRRAVNIYRGQFLEDVYSDWANAKRQALEEAYLKALAQLAAFHRDNKDFEGSLDLLNKILSRDALREDAQMEVMRCYQAMGSVSQAIKHYRGYAEQLKSELGVEPGREIRDLYQSLLRNYSPTKPR